LEQEPLVSIGEASETLGVSETALRQWTDEGKIKAFITPGGHRRYARAELKKLVTSHTKMLGIKDLVVELEDTTRMHREIAQKSLHTISWYRNLNRQSHAQLAELGRRILNLTTRYVTEPAKREETIKLARAVGHNHGEMLSKLGLPLTDSVEAFILHRDPIMQAATHLLKKREAVAGRVVEAIPLVARLMDEALVALVAAHQQCQNSSQRKRKGSAPS